MKEEIEKLAAKGMPDSEIAKTLNAKFSTVQKTTTKYWKQLMENKKGL